MTLAELGAQLREERLAQGLMVEDVAARLKVPSRILRAIEEGSVHDLPHTVYTRGFIKGYALILGYPSEKIGELTDSLEDFDDDFSPPKTLEAMPLSEDPKKKSKSGLRLFFKLFLLVLVAAGGYVYYIHTFKGGEPDLSLPGYSSSASSEASDSSGTGSSGAEPAAPSTSSSASSGVERTPAATLAPSSLPEPEEQPVLSVAEVAPRAEVPPVEEPSASQPASPAASVVPEAPAEAPTPVGSSSIDSPAATSSATTQATAVPAASASATSPEATQQPVAEPPLSRPIGSSESASIFGTDSIPSALPGDVHQIVLTATADCWVHANADNGSSTREFSMKTGETFAMPFKTSLVLKLGNAGGVRIKYNGKDMPPAGTSGQVKTLTFPPAG